MKCYSEQTRLVDFVFELKWNFGNINWHLLEISYYAFFFSERDLLCVIKKIQKLLKKFELLKH